ncbi:hypothetical protein AMS68_002429 [Peltaster fructicola]|uniref:Major facilitator superfamily (MFS) profile domain-containing protein n=1 Tax=Peltaster fructicola TaxID=286661 RepID=A0A6H0XQ68_9PEZI|nr:hypothetical protein AMS68_002429 [Peltaster fructicola]
MEVTPGDGYSGSICQSAQSPWYCRSSLQVTYKKIYTFRQKMRQIDWIGNALMIGSVISVLIALSWADARYPWSSWRILVPLVVGFAGTAIFHTWEAFQTLSRATIPPFVFSTRTSTIALILTFLQSLMTYWVIYFLPVYFQSVLLVSPGRSGVLLLPSVLSGVPTAIVAGILLTMYGRYKPLHIWAFGVSTLGVGLLINLDADSSLAKVVMYQVVSGLGAGAVLTTLLPAVQAALPHDHDVTSSTSVWAYMRSYGGVWGIAIPSSIFNSRINQLVSQIPNVAVQAALSSGNAYSQINSGELDLLPPEIKTDVVNAFANSLKTVWEVGLAVTAFCFILCFFEKEQKMHTEVNDDFALKEKKQVPKEHS